MDLKDIKAIIDLMKKNSVSEFELEKQDFKIRLKRGMNGGGALATGNALLDDIIYIDNADNGNDGLFHTSFTISGLTPGSAYSIVAYGTAGTDMVATDFRVNGIVQTTTGRNSPTSPTIFTEGADYTAFSSVLADGSGMITGYFKAHTTPNGRLSGLQIINGPVPEPTSFAVVGCIGFGFIARRRKLISRDEACDLANR